MLKVSFGWLKPTCDTRVIHFRLLFGELFLKISQMLVVCICYCYNFHIFLSFASESRVARNTILFQRDVLYGLARFNEGPGWCSGERGRPLRGYYQLHVKQNNYIYPKDMLY